MSIAYVAAVKAVKKGKTGIPENLKGTKAFLQELSDSDGIGSNRIVIRGLNLPDDQFYGFVEEPEPTTAKPYNEALLQLESKTPFSRNDEINPVNLVFVAEILDLTYIPVIDDFLSKQYPGRVISRAFEF